MTEKDKNKLIFDDTAPTLRYAPPDGYECGPAGVDLLKPDGTRVAILNFPLWISEVYDSADGRHATVEWLTPLGQHRKDSISLHTLTSTSATYAWLLSRGIEVPE